MFMHLADAFIQSSEELGLKQFLEDRQDATVLVALGRSFHFRGTTHEKSLDFL